MSRKFFSAILGLALCLPVLAGLGVSPASAVDTPGGRLPSTVPVDGTPHVLDGRVYSVVQVGNTIVLGGTFTTARNDGSSTELRRSGLLAFDKTTGRISTTFVPQPNGEVEVVLPAGDGESVYVGGAFTEIAGQARKNLVRINVSDGSLVTGFDPGNITGKVNDLRLSGGRLWVAGGFTHVDGRAQKGLATVDPTTGAFDPYMGLLVDGIHNGGSTSVRAIDITPDGRDLVAIGNFRTLEGVRTQQVLRLDLSDPAAARPENWQTAFFETVCGTAWYTIVTDVDISPDGTFFVVTTTGGYGGSSTSCDSSSRWEIATQGSDVRYSWLDKTGGDTLWSVEITDSAVYIGGHPRWQNNPFESNDPGPGAVARPGIAALDPVNGLPLSWNPTRTRGVGVFDFLVTAEGLWVASDTDRIGDFHYRGRIALMPWAGGTEFPRLRTPGLPNDLYEVSNNQLLEHSATATSFGAGAPASGGVDWSSVKAAFMLNGQAYLAASDGSFSRRSFDGATWGPAIPVDAQDQITPLTAWADDVKAMTGMFYDSGRIYFTRAKSNQLFFRYFSPESSVVGAARHVASNAVSGISFDQVRGMFLAGDRLYWTTGQSQLRSIQWAPGAISGAPVGGTQTVVSGAGVDQNDWSAARSTFLFQDAAGNNGGTDPGQPPTAAFTASCTDLACSFDAASSTPGTGTITGYSWSFGDGTNGSGVTAERTYAAGGDYTVTLTVTNSQGSTATTSQVVSPSAPPVEQPPVAAFTASCVALDCTFDGRGSSDPDGDVPLTYAWKFGDGGTGSGATASRTYAAAGSYEVELTVTDTTGRSDSITKTVAPSQTQVGVVHVGAASTNGNRNSHPVTVPGSVVAGDRLLLFMTWNNPDADVTAPAGWSLVPGGSVDGNGTRQRVWTKVATAGDAGAVVRVDSSQYAKSDLTVSAYRAAPGSELAVTASVGEVRSDGGTAHPTPEVDLPAAGSSWVVSYWASKSSGGRTWTAPASEEARASSSGGGGGAISALLADSGEGTNGGRGGGLVGTVDSSVNRVQTFTVAVTATSGEPQAPRPPVAAFTASCTALECAFDGRGSSDPDGDVPLTYAWDFGDASTGAGATVEHTYAAAGSYQVELTVTDTTGRSDSITKTVAPSQTQVGVVHVGAASTNGNRNSHPVTVPGSVVAGDRLLLFMTYNDLGAQVSAPAGWSLVPGGSVDGTKMGQRVWTKVATAADAGSVVRVGSSEFTKSDLTLSAYRATAGAELAVTGSAGAVGDSGGTSYATPEVDLPAAGSSWVVSYWGSKASGGRTWTAPASEEARASSSGGGGGAISALLADSGDGANGGRGGGLVATLDSATSQAQMFTVVVTATTAD